MFSRKHIFKHARKKKAAERRKYYTRWSIVIVVVIVIVTGLAAWGSGHERVTVRDISVSGNEITSSERVVEAAQREMNGRYLLLFDKANIAFFPKADIEKKLALAFPRIASVDIQRDSLTTLAISVLERQPAYLACAGEENAQCYFVDKTGFIYAHAPHFSGDVYTRVQAFGARNNFGIGTHITTSEMFAHMKELEALLKDRGIEIRTIQMREGAEYAFVLNSDIEFLFNTNESPERLADNFDSVLQEVSLANEEIEYIDFRFGNKVFYR